MNPGDLTVDLSLQSETAAEIALDHRWEVEYWTRFIGVDETLLRDAIEHVGPGLEAVQRYVGIRAEDAGPEEGNLPP